MRAAQTSTHRSFLARTSKSLLFGAAALTVVGCAHAPPQELLSARDAYKQAQASIASQQAPAQLHMADTALKQAEESFSKDGDSEHTRDLAYVAMRKAQLAEVQGNVLDSQTRLSQMESAMTQQQRDDLDRLRGKYQVQTQQLETSQQALEEARKRAEQANADLARIASVKQDSRGTVITLSGELLFTSGKAELMASAEAKLSEVARALTQQDKNARIMVEGYTDSQGSDAFNLDLSTRRAEAVRAYLSSHGVAEDRIGAKGLGETLPVGDNGTPQGRANNRRVEIVVQPTTAS